LKHFRTGVVLRGDGEKKRKDYKGRLQERHSNLQSVKCYSRLESPALNQFSLQENIVLSS